jgi:hypothetical protein
MKRLLCTGVIAGLVLVAIGAGTAAAVEGGALPSTYRVTYSDPMFGATTCVGTHLTGENGTATSGGKDVFFCTIGKPLKPGATYTESNMTWYSDYFAQPAVLGEYVYATSFRITVVGSGRSIIGWAVYD